METFSVLLAICAGNSPVTGEFPAQRPVTRGFDFFIYAWIKGWVNNGTPGNPRRHRAHYDVTLMGPMRKTVWGPSSVWRFQTGTEAAWWANLSAGPTQSITASRHNDSYSLYLIYYPLTKIWHIAENLPCHIVHFFVLIPKYQFEKLLHTQNRYFTQGYMHIRFTVAATF